MKAVFGWELTKGQVRRAEIPFAAGPLQADLRSKFQPGFLQYLRKLTNLKQ